MTTNPTLSTELGLTPDAIAQLRNNSFTVVDDFLPIDLANQLLSDTDNLNSNGHFKQHYFQFGGSALAKPFVYEMDLSALDGRMGDAMNNNLGSWKDMIDNIGPAFVMK
eukprot:scaffold29178_cov66-Skeletonema_marinoi.AAC.1